MIDGNSQISYYLGKDKNSQDISLIGYEMMNSLEVHQYGGLSDPPIEITTLSNTSISMLQASQLPNVPIYIDGSSNVDGLLDGGLIASKVVDGYSINIINGIYGNLTPMVDLDNKLVYHNGNIIYGLLVTGKSDGDYPANFQCLIKYCYFNSINTLVECSIPNGTYNYQPRLVYTFGFARKRNLTSGGLSQYGNYLGVSKSDLGLQPLISDTVNDNGGVLGFLPDREYGTDAIKFVMVDGLVYKALLTKDLMNNDVTDETKWELMAGGVSSGGNNTHTDTDWVAIPFINNWTNYDSVWQGGEWRIKNDQLKFRGLIHNTVPADANKNIFILPLEVRPLKKRLASIINDMNIPVRVEIDVTGEVSIPLNPLTDASITFEFTIDL